MSAATIDPPSYDVEIRGTALPEPDHEYVFAGRLGERYDTDMRSFDRADARRLRAAIEPSKVVVTDVRGGHHQRWFRDPNATCVDG